MKKLTKSVFLLKQLIDLSFSHDLKSGRGDNKNSQAGMPVPPGTKLMIQKSQAGMPVPPGTK